MDSLKKINTYNWIDITEDFKNATEKLKLGELVHDVMFSLYDAMAAIELMDPKMDAGMVGQKNKKNYKFEDMIKENLIKIDSFTTEELIGIIDDTYSCLVTWMNGHSLAQTVFINVFLHNPQLICDKTLKTFCITMLKIVDMISNFISRAAVYEEEDFQPKNYGFDLASNVNISKILPMLKVNEDEIRTEICNESENNCSTNTNHDRRKKMEALLIRIKFTKYFFLCFYAFKKYLYQQNALSLGEFLSQLNENLDLSEDLLVHWLATIDYGIQPNNITTITNVEQSSSSQINNNKPDYPTIIGFEPLINQRLLAPSFPRYTKIKSRKETIQFLRELLQRIRKLLKVQEIEKFIDVLKFFNTYSQQTPSCVVSRSLLQLFYLPQDDHVFGEREFIQIVKESCKRFIKPPILCGKITLDTDTKENVESFFDFCSRFFKKILQIYGHNRASQRGKLEMIFKDVVYIGEQCAVLEQILIYRKFCDHLQVWIMFYKFYFISQYLLTGFELELYSIHEFGYIYFELDHIWDYISLIVKRALENYMEHELFLNSTNNSTTVNSKNSRKKNKSKIIRNRFNIHEIFITYYKGMNQMAAAMNRLMMAFMIDEKIKPLKQSLNSEEIRYKHRFSPLLQLEGTLQSYLNYSECFDSFVRSKSSTRLLYTEACQLFEQARKHFESLQQNDLTFQDEVQSYIKVAKTNNIVLKLFLSGHNEKGCVEFNFIDTVYFPTIRFGTTTTTTTTMVTKNEN
ncbi:N-alpha-acetyltransferase 35 [Dermatophagoides farinae]|uniref:N-alpha-acetyltransferase 35 n=1 Tax=Dermatophagoides farinae TaxID=6954 RepID=UPI003F5E9AE1